MIRRLVESRFAWLPTNTDDGLIWLKSYEIHYDVHYAPHYCHDCVNPITPCSGKEFDEIVQFVKATK